MSTYPGSQPTLATIDRRPPPAGLVTAQPVPLLAAGPPVAGTAQTTALLTKRRADIVALFMVATLLFTILTSVIAHSPRSLLAKDGLITGLGASGSWPACARGVRPVPDPRGSLAGSSPGRARTSASNNQSTS